MLRSMCAYMQVPIGLIWTDGRSPLSQARCTWLLAFEGLGRDLLDLVRHGDDGGGGEDGVEGERQRLGTKSGDAVSLI